MTVDLPNGKNYAQLTELVKQGKISTKALDEQVAYVLRLKFKLGLFDDQKPIDLLEAKKHINQPESRALALKTAEESIILLKNENNILPLAKVQNKTIAVNRSIRCEKLYW